MIGLWSVGNTAEAAEPPICTTAKSDLSDLCGVIEAKCLPYLDDPGSVSPNDISPIPATFRHYFESALNAHVIGYQQTDLPQAMVVFLYDEPACEVLVHGLAYSKLIAGYSDWRAGPGDRFAATSEFEPVSKTAMDRAYAATFLAAPMKDGRVTEITLNWNLSFEGLTRFRVSYQPLRDHTRALMQVEMK
jgi:hypothetical protein